MSTTMNIPERVLSDLVKIDGVDSSAIANSEGLFISNMEGPHSKTFAAMSERILGISNKEPGMELPARMVVESNQGKLIAVSADSGTMVMAITRKNIKMTTVLEELERAAQQIGKKEVLK